MAQDPKNQPAAASDGASGVNTGVAVIGFLLCFLAGVVLMWGYDQRRKGSEITADTAGSSQTWDDSDSPVPVTSKDPQWGKRDALVTIVEFSDFQCPYCSRVEPTMDQVRQAYGPDKVRVLWKNNPLPFHQNAKPAAEAGQGVFSMAGSDAFWKFHDAAFKNQGALSEDSYEKWAKDAGVTDLAAYKAGLSGHKWADKVDKDLNEGKAAGVQGTPSFFVNGVFINGAQPFDNFKKTIDQELDKAKAKVAAGTSKNRVYVEMSKDNKKNAPPSKDDSDDKEDTTSVFKVPVGSSPVLGDPRAPVTMIVFSDFQCPFCGRVEPTLKSLRDKYGDKLRMVWKNEPLPFHPAAEPAAEAALEVRAEKGDKGFWDVHDKFFASQKDLTTGQNPNLDAITKIAVDAGASADKVKKAISDHTHKKEIDGDSDLAEDVQASGTPHFFINGRRLVGAQPQEKFEKIIDEEVKKAQDLVAKGVRPADLYDALTKDGKGAPEPEKKDLPKSIPSNDPAWGPANAKVVIHEWSDFQCPFCGRVEPTVAQIKKDYGDRLRFVWHDMPLPMHPDAPLAAEAGREAFAQKGPTAFWAMHDKMFANQQKIKRDDLDGYAKDLNLNMDKWKAALDGSTHTSEIEADKKPANEDGIGGTPAFLIASSSATSGYFVNGAQSYGKFRKLIERAYSEAK